MEMVELDVLVRVKIRIPKSMDQDLEDGDPAAFKDLELELKGALENRFVVSKIEIADAGPYNDAGAWSV